MASRAPGQSSIDIRAVPARASMRFVPGAVLASLVVTFLILLISNR